MIFLILVFICVRAEELWLGQHLVMLDKTVDETFTHSLFPASCFGPSGFSAKWQQRIEFEYTGDFKLDKYSFVSLTNTAFNPSFTDFQGKQLISFKLKTVKNYEELVFKVLNKEISFYVEKEASSVFFTFGSYAVLIVFAVLIVVFSHQKECSLSFIANEMVIIEGRQAITFVLGASAALLTIYLLADYIRVLMEIGAALLSFSCFIVLLKGQLNKVKLLGTMCCTPFSFSEVISTFASLALLLWYIFTKHTVANNLFAWALIVSVVGTYKVSSFKTCFAFLTALMLYDVFWVYFSDQVFQENVMVSAASALDIPNKICIPDLSFRPYSRNVIMGLGDVVVPAVIAKYCWEYEFYLERKSYYVTSIALFFVSVTAAVIGVLAFEHPQPVLFYIAPLMGLGLLILAALRGEALKFWNGVIPITYQELANRK